MHIFWKNATVFNSAMELLFFVYCITSSFIFGKQESQYCQNLRLYTANIPHSSHLLSSDLIYKSAQDSVIFQFLLNFKAPMAFLGVLVSSL
jgi:hypothetical protein